MESTVLKRIRRFLATMAVLIIALFALVAWDVFFNDGRFFGRPGSDSSVLGTGDQDYADLEIVEGNFGAFDGTITVRNPTSSYQDVQVSVDVFDGDHNVGDLFGTVTLKPNSSSSVDLSSMDDYVGWSDAHVDLLRLPG